MANYQGEPQYEDQMSEDEALEPTSSKRLLIAIKNAEKKFNAYQSKADRIDKLYANLDTWSSFYGNGGIFDHEFNLFWASMEVVKPSIYSRPPIPVVTPVFKDRSPIVRTGSEMLERCAVRGFSISDIDQVMLGVRDDLAIVARGVIWCTYESGDDAKPYGERVCIEHLDRKDFLHEPARKWADVGWVARRAWLTRKEAKKRFGTKADNASYGQHKDERGEEVDNTPKAGFWEIWSKVDRKVYWVAEGCEEVLDEDEPFLKLKNFFPCPRPAYATLERRSLVPVPDIVYIEDQLESINELTSRIHGLCEKLVVRGIIPAGSDVGDALETAYRNLDADHMIIPVPAAAFNTASKYVDWLPIDMIAQALISAVEARRELIGNVQELLGIADIMRGESEAQETLGAQKLKAQFGSVRIRDKISELVRIGRDTLQIMSEIQAEEFDFDTLLEMSRMELPKRSEIKKQLSDIKDSAKKELTALADKAEEALQAPEAQQNPQEAQQQFQQAQEAILAKFQPIIDKLGKAVTQEDVKELLAEQKTGFADFDIQTDSTIYPDEQAAKQAVSELLMSISSSIVGLQPMVATGKEGAKLAGDLIKMAIAPHRPGREIEGSIDEWVQSMANMPQAPNPEAEKAKAQAALDQQKMQIEMQKLQASLAQVQADNQFRAQELKLKEAELSLKAQEIQAKPQTELAKVQAKAQTDMQKSQTDAEVAVIRERAQLDADAQTTQMSLDAEAALEAQRSQAETAKMLLDENFRRDELVTKTELEWAKLQQQEQQAEPAAQEARERPNAQE